MTPASTVLSEIVNSKKVNYLQAEDEIAVMNIALGAATDPWMYALGLGGFGMGAKAGEGLEAAALARGPGFKTTPKMLQAMTRTGVPGLFSEPQAARMLSEIPEGSQFFTQGGEATVLRTPSGRLIRIGMEPGAASEIEGRFASPNVLQMDRTVAIPHGENAWRIEHMPMADDVGSRGIKHELKQSLRHEGLAPVDFHEGNYARDPMTGRPTVIDPGAVYSQESSFTSRQPVIQSADPGRTTNLILDLLRADPRLQAALAAGHQNTGLRGLLGSMGAGFGASLPVGLRLGGS